MFKTTDKVKELVKFFLKNSEISCFIYENRMYKPMGISVVMTYTYTMNDIEIMYDKWYVQNYETAKSMGLPGIEHHDQLVKGSGVTVVSKQYGNFIFYGNDAKEIINACEYGRDLSVHTLQTFNTIQR